MILYYLYSSYKVPASRLVEKLVTLCLQKSRVKGQAVDSTRVTSPGVKMLRSAWGSSAYRIRLSVRVQ